DAQTESAILHVFGTDSRLIEDGTYFLAEEVEEVEEVEGEGRGRLVGCGGWSRRRPLVGRGQMKTSGEAPRGPETEPARIRAFFVHPDCARRGIGSRILGACLDAARSAGFRRVTLASTLPGVPFYSALGFEEKERIEVPMPGGLTLPVIRMERNVAPLPAGEGVGVRGGHCSEARRHRLPLRRAPRVPARRPGGPAAHPLGADDRLVERVERERLRDRSVALLRRGRLRSPAGRRPLGPHRVLGRGPPRPRA